MAKKKGKYQVWLEPDKLAQIENWAAKGNTDTEIANNMGVARSTFKVWKNRFQAISAALEKGRAESIVAIENMMFKVAMGEATEQQIVKVRDRGGSEHVEVRERRLAPNTAMLIFLAKNRAGYSDNPNARSNEAATKIILGVEPKRYGRKRG